MFLTVLLTLAACGIPLDSEPEIIAADDLPAGLRTQEVGTTSTVLESIAEEITIYLVRPADDGTNLLEPVIRQVAAVESTDLARSALEQVFAGPTAEEREELITLAVGSTDEPIQVEETRRPAEGRLVVVLSELPSIEGRERVTAFAQMVFTVTAFETVDEVRFQVTNDAGEPEFITVNTDDGDVNAFVGPDDYNSLAPTVAPS
jgi:spore germination protein GerM